MRRVLWPMLENAFPGKIIPNVIFEYARMEIAWYCEGPPSKPKMHAIYKDYINNEGEFIPKPGFRESGVYVDPNNSLKVYSWSICRMCALYDVPRHIENCSEMGLIGGTFR